MGGVNGFEICGLIVFVFINGLIVLRIGVVMGYLFLAAAD